MAYGDNMNTTSSLTANIATYYEKTLLDRLEKELLFYKFGQMAKIPKHGGKVITWTRYSNMSAVTDTLTEGTTPTDLALTSANVTATLAQHGAHVLVSDILPLVAIDDTIVSASEVLGYQAALSMDTIIRNVLKSGGTVQYASGKSALSDLAASDTFDSGEIRKAVRTLEAADVRTHPKTPGYYVGIIHSYQKYDFIGDTATGGFVDVTKYTTREPLAKNEIGRYGGVQFFTTSNCSTESGAVTVYHSFVFGDGAYGVVEVGGGSKNPQMIIHRPGEAGAKDPLDQIGSVGWKLLFVSKVLDANRLIVVKTGATA
jgi:N4-gp56 family major capsid protein